uniref:LysR family transcriptional regulator n=1 Tax=Roseovarius sp. BRH_c41 TaxID=1629709 RepID=UPI0025F762A0|nr:LysR family transcriptional regulator [Roseovarius sp. BRH_c41]
MLDARQLRYFLEIAKQGSITAASQTLGVAQPALSQQLRKLEDQLGTPLMLRQRSGVVPTEAGLLLAERARRILDEMSRTIDDISTLGSNPSGVVRIGLPGTISSMVSLPLIAAAHKLYPRITINIAEAMSGFIAAWMAEDRVDLAILYRDIGFPGFQSDLLLEEDLVILSNPDSDMAARLPLAAMAGQSMVLPSKGHGLRDLIDEKFQSVGVTAGVAIEIDSYANIKSLVANGFGPSILPAHAVRAERDAGTLSVSQIEGDDLRRRVYLILPTGRPVTRAQMVVADLLRHVVTDLIEAETWAGARLLSG